MGSENDIDVENLPQYLVTFVQAMDNGHMDIIDSLINMKLQDPRSPLDINHCAILASIRGNIPVLTKVLALNPRMAFEDKYGRRAIHYAAKNGHLECARLLLKAGAISNCSDMFGRSPLHLACSSGHADIVSLLVQQCAHINSSRSETGENALHVTATTSHIEVMKLLLDNGGNINAAARQKIGGDTPLHKAVAVDNTDMVEYLCQRGAQLNIPSLHGKCPIHIAAEKGFLRCVSILIHHGASLDVTEDHRRTPLSSAIMVNETSVAKLLVDEGASLHAVDKFGYTPMHIASIKGNVELINYFIAAGANVNARTPVSLHTPLMSAITMGQLAAIQTLTAQGADVTLPDSNGHTPLHSVHMKLGGASTDEIIKVLLKGGGRLDARDSGNLTPLQRGIVVSVIRRAPILPWLQLVCQAGSSLGPDQYTMGKHSPLFWLAYSGFLKEALYLARVGWDLNDEIWIVLPGRDDVQDRLHRFMIATFKTVPSLLASCRKVVRSHLIAVREGREILSTIDSLPIPRSLQSFLKMFDIDPADVSALEPGV